MCHALYLEHSRRFGYLLCLPWCCITLYEPYYTGGPALPIASCLFVVCHICLPSTLLPVPRPLLLSSPYQDWPSLAHMLLDSVMKLMVHSTAVGESQGESPVKCCTLDPTGQQLARKLLELALELGVEVRWRGSGWGWGG